MIKSKKHLKSIIIYSLILLFSISINNVVFAKNKNLTFVILYPGGPDTGKSGKKIINQFISTLANASGVSSKKMQGKYFNNIKKAKRYIKKNRNSFIMGSLGFFLGNKKSLKLDPIALVLLQGSNFEQYRIVVKKGRYSNLSQLKKKTLAGNVLYENSKFIDKIIFNKKLKSKRYFKLKKTKRPLSTIRKVSKGRIDAAIISQMEYNNLKGLSFFSKLDVIYTSPKLPPLGFMMRSTSVTESYKNRILNAVLNLCSSQSGSSVCSSFGLKGFKKISQSEINNVVKEYNSR